VNRDSRIDAYSARAQPFALPIIEHVRERVHATLPECEESVKWGMPAYVVDGKILLMTPAFKAHAALNFWRGQELREEKPDSEAMGQFGKLRSLDDLPSDAELDRLIREAADLARNPPAPRKPKHAPKPLPAMHPDFATALTDAPEAKSYFDDFAPSAQREYLEWVTEAKRDETRTRRIATAIEWLSEGKTRNWKYERS